MDQPPIRILQRPCQLHSEKPVEFSRPPAAVKTLEQREADYAAARRRIMGSETPENMEAEKPTNKGSSKAIPTPGQNCTTAQRQPSNVLNGSSTSATPLMSIQTTPISVDFSLGLTASTTSIAPALAIAQPRSSRSSRQSLAVVSVAQKLQQQQQQSVLNGNRQSQRPVQQQRVLSASASSPALLSHAARPQVMPLINPLDPSNAGLLPTPVSLNAIMQNMPLAANFSQSPMATAALMHHFTLLQQQYQQTFAGLQSQLMNSLATTSTPGINQLNFSSTVQPAIPSRYSHPSGFS